MKVVKVKRYELNTSATISQLKSLGFKEGYWEESTKECYVKENWLSKFYSLDAKNDIEMYLSINLKDLANWNDFDNIMVIDDTFGQPYGPFYTYRDGRKILFVNQFPVLERIYTRYEKIMDELVDHGILKVVEKDRKGTM